MAADDDSDVMAGILDSDDDTDEDTHSSSTNPYMKFMPASLAPSPGAYNLPHQPGAMEPKKEKGVDRLLMMLKYPNAREEDIQEVLKRKEIHQQALQAAAVKKGQQFRERRELEDAERWKQQKELEELKLQGLEHEHKNIQKQKGRSNIKKFVMRSKKPTEGSFDQAVSNKISPRRAQKTEDDQNRDGAVIWQAATDGTEVVDFEAGIKNNSATGSQSPNKTKSSKNFFQQTRKSIRSAFGIGKKDDLVVAGDNVTIGAGDSVSINTSNGYDGQSHDLPTSEASVVTQKMSNIREPMSRGRSEVDTQAAVNNIYLVSSFSKEDPEEQNNEESNKKSWIVDRKKNKLLIIILSLVIVVAVIVTVLAALYGQRRGGNIDTSKSSENQQTDIIIDTIEFDPSPSPSPSDKAVEDWNNIIPSARPASVTTEPPADATGSIFTPTALPTESPNLSTPTNVQPEEALSTLDEQPFLDWVWTEGEEEGTVLQGIPAIDEHYGQSVALSHDGQTLVIGAPGAFNGAGIVRIYEQQGDSWVSIGSLLGRNEGDQFGSSVALSSDGRVLAVSEPSFDGNAGDKTGNIRTYVYSPFGYVLMGQEIEGDDASDQFGIGLSLSSDGRRLAVGAPNHASGDGDTRLVSGAVRVFEWSEQNNKWVSIGNGLDGSPLVGTHDRDRFGWSVDLNDDGSLLCIGAPRNEIYGGYVQCFEETSDASSKGWTQVGNTIENKDGEVRYDDQFGSSVRVSRDPSGFRHRVAIGAHGKNDDNIFNAGHVVVNEFNPSAAERGWIRLGKKVITTETPGQDFRMGFALDFHEDLLAVGIPGANDGVGIVEIFEFQKSSWEWLRSPSIFEGVASGLLSSFGEAISMTPSGDFAVGSPQSNNDVGSVTFYRRTMT